MKVLGRTTSWSRKSNVFTARNEIATVTFFAKTSTALTNRSAFASPTEWQDPGKHRCWFKVSSPACRLPIFAKAPCCLELFGCCWVGNVYRFFAVLFCVGVFCLFALFWWVCFWLVFVLGLVYWWWLHYGLLACYSSLLMALCMR